MTHAALVLVLLAFLVTGCMKKSGSVETLTQAPPQTSVTEKAPVKTPGAGDEKEAAEVKAQQPLSPEAEALLAELKIENDTVRKKAAEELASFDHPDVTKGLVKALGTGSGASFTIAKILVKIGKPAVDPLIELLKDPDAKYKRYAAEVLGDIGDERALDPLIEAILAKPGYDSAYGAENGLIAMGKKGKPVVDPMIKLLEHENPKVRQSAATVLGKIRNPKAIKPLIEAMHNTKYADQMLTWFAADLVIQGVTDKLKDKNAKVRIAALKALGKLHQVATVDFVAKLLKDDDADVRKAAADALAKIGGSYAKSYLQTIADEPDPDMAAAVIDELRDELDGFWGDEENRKPKPLKDIIKSLKHKNPYIRMAALEALVDLWDQGWGETFCDYWDSPCPITDWKIPLPLKSLAKLLEDKHPKVREKAILKIKKVLHTGQELPSIKPVIKFAKDKDPKIRMAVIGILEFQGSWDAVMPLIELIDDENSQVRDGAVWALKYLNLGKKKAKEAKKAVGPLKKLLHHEDPNVREAALRTLGKLNDKSGVEPIKELLEDKNASVRAAAAQALDEMKIPIPVSMDLLKKQLDDDDEYTRITAVKILAKLKDPAVFKLLAKALDDDDYAVVKLAVKALLDREPAQAVHPLLDLLASGKKYSEDWEEVNSAEMVEGALFQIGKKNAGLLIEALKSEKDQIKPTLGKLLGDLMDPKSVQPLIDLLNDQSSATGKAAGAALGKIGKPAVKLLIEALKHDGWKVRAGAAWALGFIRNAKAVKPLIDLFGDSNSEVKKNVLTALKFITSQELGPDPGAWEKWWKKQKKGWEPDPYFPFAEPYYDVKTLEAECDSIMYEGIGSLKSCEILDRLYPEEFYYPYHFECENMVDDCIREEMGRYDLKPDCSELGKQECEKLEKQIDEDFLKYYPECAWE